MKSFQPLVSQDDTDSQGNIDLVLCSKFTVKQGFSQLEFFFRQPITIVAKTAKID